MDISGVSSQLQSTGVVSHSATAATSATARVERERDAAGQADAGRRGGQLLKALAQTLDQLGFSLPKSDGAQPATASQANDAETAAASSSAQNVSQALHGFMHSLFQTLAAGDKEAGGNAKNDALIDKTGAYSDLAGSLQNLVQSLSTASPSGVALTASATSLTGDTSTANTSSAASSDLSAAYQNLARALEASGGSKGNTPDLQTFLKTLQQNLNSSGSTLDSAGNLVNTNA